MGFTYMKMLLLVTGALQCHAHLSSALLKPSNMVLDPTSYANLQTLYVTIVCNDAGFSADHLQRTACGLHKLCLQPHGLIFTVKLSCAFVFKVHSWTQFVYVSKVD